MAASKVEKALAILADHLAGNEANYRDRETGAKLHEVLGTDPGATSSDEPEAADTDEEK